MSFREAEPTEWQIGPATFRAASVTHRGPTLGYRITEATRPRLHPRPRAGARHAAGHARGRVDLRPRARARRRPADPRRPVHRRGVPAPPRLGALLARDTLAFARRAGAGRLLAFHHDPLHSDAMLDLLAADAQRPLAGPRRNLRQPRPRVGVDGDRHRGRRARLGGLIPSRTAALDQAPQPHPGAAPADLELVDVDEVVGLLRRAPARVDVARRTAGSGVPLVMPSSRAAVLVVSPIAVYSSRRSEPTLPRITVPLLSPMPIRKPSPMPSLAQPRR